MSDEGWKAIAQIAILLTAMGSLISSLLNRRLGKRTAKAVDDVATNVNGKMEHLIKAAGAEERAVGEATGREKAIAEGRERVAEVIELVERVEDRAAGKPVSQEKD